MVCQSRCVSTTRRIVVLPIIQSSLVVDIVNSTTKVSECQQRNRHQRSTGAFLLHTAPLLKEERHAGRRALIAHLRHPPNVQRTRARPGLAAQDDPVDAGQVQRRQRSQQRLSRNVCADRYPMVESLSVRCGIDRWTKSVRRRIEEGSRYEHECRFCQRQQPR